MIYFRGIVAKADGKSTGTIAPFRACLKIKRIMNVQKSESLEKQGKETLC